MEILSDDLIFFIEEEDLDLNETPINEVDNNIYGKRLDYTGTYLGLKIIFKVIENEEFLIHEVKLRIKNQCSFLSHFYGVCQHSELGLGIVVSFNLGQDLLSDIDIATRKEFAIQLSHIFYFFNSRGVFLGDITLDSLVCVNGKVTIQDLPMSSLNSSNQYLMSPESVKRRLAPPEGSTAGICKYTESWSLGQLIFEIISGHPLSDEVKSNCDTKSMVKAINNLQVSIQFKNLLKKLMKNKPEQRLLTHQILPIISSLKENFESTFNLTEIQVNSSHYATNLSKREHQNQNIKAAWRKSSIDSGEDAKSASIKGKNTQAIDSLKERSEYKEESEAEKLVNYNYNDDEKLKNKSNMLCQSQSVQDKTCTDLNKCNTEIPADILPEAEDRNEFKALECSYCSEPSIAESQDIRESMISINNNLLERDGNETVNSKLIDFDSKYEYNIFQIFNDETCTRQGQTSTEILKSLFENSDFKEDKKRIDVEKILDSFSKIEVLSSKYKKTMSEKLLYELENIISITNIQHIEPTILSNISHCAWNTLMCLAFKLLDHESFKNHHIASYILYYSVEHLFSNDKSKLAYAQFHYGISLKEFHCNFEKGLSLLEECVSHLFSLGQLHSKLGILAKYYIGNILDDLGETEKSIEILKEVLDLQKKTFDDDESVIIGKTYNCLGICEDNRKNFKIAMEHYAKSFQILNKCQASSETPEIAKVLNNMAGIFYNWENYEKSWSYYMKVCKIYSKAFGDNSTQVATSYNNLGNVSICLGKNEEAESYYKQSIYLYRQLLEPSHIQLGMVYKNLADLYNISNRAKEATELYEASLSIFKDKLGIESEMYISTKNKLSKHLL